MNPIWPFLHLTMFIKQNMHGCVFLIPAKGQCLTCRLPLSMTVNIWTSRWALHTWRNAITFVCVCVCMLGDHAEMTSLRFRESRCSIMRHDNNALSPISANGPQGQQVCSIASCRFNEAGHICLPVSHTHTHTHTCSVFPQTHVCMHAMSYRVKLKTFAQPALF